MPDGSTKASGPLSPQASNRAFRLLCFDVEPAAWMPSKHHPIKMEATSPINVHGKFLLNFFFFGGGGGVHYGPSHFVLIFLCLKASQPRGGATVTDYLTLCQPSLSQRHGFDARNGSWWQIQSAALQLALYLLKLTTRHLNTLYWNGKGLVMKEMFRKQSWMLKKKNTLNKSRNYV